MFTQFKAHLVRTASRDETTPAAGASSPTDGCPSQAEDKSMISDIVSISHAADSEADVHTSVLENGSQSVLTTCDVEMISSQGTASAAVSSLMDSPRISHPSTMQVTDDAQMSSEMLSHPTDTNEKSSLLVEDERQDSKVTIGSKIGNSKRPKPSSLFLMSPPKENLETYSIPTPQTAPPVTARSPRPLPPLPKVLRQVRPLPQPPAPLYTSPAGSPPLYSASQSPSAISSSVSQITARFPANLVLDQLSDQPNISRRPVAPVILTNSSSETPLTVDIPSSSSSVTAKRHWLSESSEVISDTLGTSDTRQKDDKQAGRRIVDTLGPKQTTIPVCRFRDTDVSKRRHRMQTARPHAIYLIGNLSDELYDNGEEEGCTSESSISESLSTSLDLPVDVDADEDLDDKSFMFSSEDGIISEGLDDFEEAYIGLAQPNVVTYQKESHVHVKRATRAWVLGSNGQMWLGLNNPREA